MPLFKPLVMMIRMKTVPRQGLFITTTVMAEDDELKARVARAQKPHQAVMDRGMRRVRDGNAPFGMTINRKFCFRLGYITVSSAMMTCTLIF